MKFEGNQVATWKERKLRRVPVFYGTCRAINLKHEPSEPNYYSSQGQLSTLKYGLCFVGVPADDKVELRTRPTWWQPIVSRKNETLNYEKAIPLSQSAFLTKLNSEVAEGDLLVFIHGFNTSFEDAILDTALLAYQVNLRGAACVYSWPSFSDHWPTKIEKLTKLRHTYDFDLVASANAVSYFEEFLLTISKKSRAAKIHIVAFSMGNRIVANALNDMQLPPNIATISLVAPDLELSKLKELVPNVKSDLTSITLYACSNDLALRVGEWITSYARAGFVADRPFVANGLDTVDASFVNNNLIGHGYLSSSPIVFSDLHYVILGVQPQWRSCLDRYEDYWVFNKNCAK